MTQSHFEYYLNKALPWFGPYIIGLAGVLLVYALVEVIFPNRVFAIWKRFVESRVFRFYGILLMLGGFPLTQFRANFSGKAMMVVGLLVMISGPYILLFPEKSRDIVHPEEFGIEDTRSLIYTDAAIKSACGLLFLYNILLS